MTMTNLDLDIFNFGENWAAMALNCRVHLKCLCTVHMHWHSTSEMFKASLCIVYVKEIN